MAAVDTYLVRRGDGLVLLFTPPFGTTSWRPATSGVRAGVRENGGQYTHAAVWAAIAFGARDGDSPRAFAMLTHQSRPHDAESSATVEPYVVAGDVMPSRRTSARGLDLVHGSAGWSIGPAWSRPASAARPRMLIDP